ncbi:MAG: alpha/beta fold hydrolase [Spirochaetales bacterium]|nr:alpha/beta fold hydrolase [Spirochaetales bacterium]
MDGHAGRARRTFPLAILAWIAGILAGCAGSAALRNDAALDAEYRARMAVAFGAGTASQEADDLLAEYGERFGTLPERVTWRTIRTGSGLAINVFRTGNARGTAMVVHGYLDDSTAMSGIIRTCLESGWSVLAVDLPGHGLSGGPRADTRDLADYGRALSEAADFAAGYTEGGPLVAVAHSAGGLAALEWARLEAGNPASRLEGLFLMAPLVRPRAWWLLGPLTGIAGVFTDRLPVEANEGLFLNPKYLPLGWTGALRRWLRRTKDFPVLDLSAVIAYGEDENVLDVKYARRFFTRTLPGAEWISVEDGGHFGIAQGDASPVVRAALGPFLDGIARGSGR